MLTCETVTQILMDAPVDDLPAARAKQVRAHLGDCEDCAQFVAAYDAVAPMVRSALEVQVDDALQAELDAAVMEAIQRSA